MLKPWGWIRLHAKAIWWVFVRNVIPCYHCFHYDSVIKPALHTLTYWTYDKTPYSRKIVGICEYHAMTWESDMASGTAKIRNQRFEMVVIRNVVFATEMEVSRHFVVDDVMET